MKLIPMILKHVTTSRKERTLLSSSKVAKLKIINNRKAMKNRNKELDVLEFLNNLYDLNVCDCLKSWFVFQM